MQINNKTNTIILYITSLVSVLIGVGTSVINTNSLSVTDYGDVRYINNFLNFFSSILLFGFFVSGARLLAITKDPERRREINGVMVIILMIASLLSIIFMLGCYLIHKSILHSNSSYLFLISLPVAFAPLLLNYVNNTFQGENRIINLSIARLLPGLLYLIVAFVLYKFVDVTSSLMILLQNGLLLIVMIFNIVFTKPSFKNIKSRFIELWNENKRYGLHVYCGAIFAVAFGYLAGIFLGIFGQDNANVGFYTLAVTLSTPLSMLPSIIGTSYFKEFANQTKVDRKLLIVTMGLSICSYVVFVIAIYPVVMLLYDEAYIGVAEYSSFLALGAIFHGIGDLFNRFLGAHGLGKNLRNGAILTGIMLVFGNIILVYFFDIKGAIITKILSSMTYMLAMVYYYRCFLSSNNR